LTSSTKKKRKNKSHSFWYTGVGLLKKIIGVLDYISIDPASSTAANQRVGAKHIYTYQRSCLTRSRWLERDSGDDIITCFMNPPYSGDCGGTKPFAEKLIEQMKKEVVDVAIVLVNSSTSASWFNLLMDNCEYVCFPSSREKFDEDLDYVKKYVPSIPLDPSDTGLRTGNSPRYDNAIFLIFSPNTKCDKTKYKSNFIKEMKSVGTILSKIL
jgi:hypothetical protein